MFISKNKKRWKKKDKKIKRGGHYGGHYGGSYFTNKFCAVFVEELDGGGGSVRRRNTLHVVGGRQFKLSQARFMGREKKCERK